MTIGYLRKTTSDELHLGQVGQECVWRVAPPYIAPPYSPPPPTQYATLSTNNGTPSGIVPSSVAIGPGWSTSGTTITEVRPGLWKIVYWIMYYTDTGSGYSKYVDYTTEDPT